MPTKEYYERNREKCIAATQAWKVQNRDKSRANANNYMKRLRSTEEGRERTNGAGKKWRDRNSEKVKELRQGWYAENGREYYRKWAADKRVSDPVLFILRNARNRAKKLGVEFNLTRDDIVVPDVCPVLGLTIFKGEGHGRDNSPSVDRFDTCKGYTADNIRIVSWRANRLKSDGTLDEFRKLVAYMEGAA